MSEFLSGDKVGSATYALFESEIHGVGVKALKPFEAEEVIFQEQPDTMMQSIPNKQLCLVCGCCSRFIGSHQFQSGVLQKSIERSALVTTSAVPGAIFFNCKNCCGELYCSESCREKHWSEKAHCMLCTGCLREEEVETSPLYALKVFAVETNEIFLMVAEVLGKLCLKVDRMVEAEGKSLTEALIKATEPYETFVRREWWEVAVSSSESTKKSKEAFKATLRSLVNDCWELMDDVLHISEKGYDSVINAEYIARTIGMFEQNNVGVRLRSPLALLVESLQPGDARIAAILSDTKEIVSKIEGDAWCDAEDGDETESEEDEIEAEEERGDVDGVIKSGDRDEQRHFDTSTSDAKLNELHTVLNDEVIDNVFPPLDGTAFYLTICRINHSCVPNVVVRYASNADKGLVAHLTALCHINPDEELVQSYIDQSLPFEDRQRALLDYGIVCTCLKCRDRA